MFPQGSAAAQAVMQGFVNDSIAYSNQNITYTFSFIATSPSLTQNQTYVTKGEFSNENQYGDNSYNYKFNGVTGLNQVTNSTIDVSSSIATDTSALTYAIAHEESHDNFLGDCPDCDADSTIMSYLTNILNPPFEGPTSDDIDAEDEFSGADFGGVGGSPCGSSPACPVQP